MDTQRIDIPGQSVQVFAPVAPPAAPADTPNFYDRQTTLVALRVVEGPLKDTLVVLKEGLNVIGRDLSCDHALLHPTVSRRHCTVDLNDNGLSIIDMGSLHGVVVNGRLINASRLFPRDEVYLGDVRLHVETRLRQSARPQPRVIRRTPEEIAALAAEDTKLVANPPPPPSGPIAAVLPLAPIDIAARDEGTTNVRHLLSATTGMIPVPSKL